MENNLSEYIKNHPRISSASMVFSYQKELVNNLNLKIIGSEKFAFIKDDLKNIESFLLDNKENIDKYEIFKYSINQATDLFDYENKGILYKFFLWYCDIFYLIFLLFCHRNIVILE